MESGLVHESMTSIQYPMSYSRQYQHLIMMLDWIGPISTKLSQQLLIGLPWKLDTFMSPLGWILMNLVILKWFILMTNLSNSLV